MVAAFLPSIAYGQTTSDALACADVQRSLEERKTFFASVSWARDDTRSRCVLLTAMVLGNIEGTKPDTWHNTRDWAAGLADTYDYSLKSAYAWQGSAVLLGNNSAHEETCIFVSDRPFLKTLLSRYPGASARKDGPRSFVTYDDGKMRFLATEFAAASDVNLLEQCGNPVFTASFVIRNPDS